MISAMLYAVLSSRYVDSQYIFSNNRCRVYGIDEEENEQSYG